MERLDLRCSSLCLIAAISTSISHNILSACSDNLLGELWMFCCESTTVIVNDGDDDMLDERGESLDWISEFITISSDIPSKHNSSNRRLVISV